ncbi:MAG: putative toxin-antitoxin system toxin component, PIN family [Pirellulales bacterium]|nr:putative toxin-antitoxin system toxin component, PIN family [Pirellulales bacterium]
MIQAALDTNVVVRGILASHPQSASRRVLDALYQGDFTLLLSPETLVEIERVLSDESIRSQHGWSPAEIRRFCEGLQGVCRMVAPVTIVPPSLPRDVTDAKWLALVFDAGADFLVTHDTKHLGRLKKFGTTAIVTPAAFLRAVARGAER